MLHVSRLLCFQLGLIYGGGPTLYRQLNPAESDCTPCEDVSSEPNKKSSKCDSNDGADNANESMDVDGLTDKKEETVTESLREEPVGMESMDPLNMPPERVFKVVFIGNSGVGKTSFIHYFCQGQFLTDVCSTVGIDYQMRSLIVDNVSVVLQLWDTAGQERFLSITKQYFRKADGILAMYDVTQTCSFLAVRNWLQSVKDGMEDGAVIFLLANKTDAVETVGRIVSYDEGYHLAQEYQAYFYECSAKSGYNINESMIHMARLLTEQEDKCYSAICLENVPIKKKNCCK